MASVSQLGGNLIGVAPVKGSAGGTSEEVGRIGSQGQTGAGAHNFGLTLNKHVLNVDLGNGAVTSTSKEITVGKKGEHVDTLLEKALGGANTLVEATLKVDLNDVTSKGTKVSTGISGVDADALVLALDLAHVDVLVGYLFGNKVASPDAEAVVMDGDELVVGGVEEGDLVSNVHADGVAADGLAALDLPNDQLVVVLTTK